MGVMKLNLKGEFARVVELSAQVVGLSEQLILSNPLLKLFLILGGFMVFLKFAPVA